MAIVPASPPSESKRSPANVRRAKRRGLFRMSAASPARIRIAPSAPSVTAARKNGEVAISDAMAETIICQEIRDLPRVLSPSHPDVLALRQGQASHAPLHQSPARRPPLWLTSDLSDI